MSPTKVFWLFVGTFLISAGAASMSVLPMLAGTVVGMFAWVEHKPNVLRMLRDGHTIIDNSEGAFTLVAFDKWWLAHFGIDWFGRYGHTWAFGCGRDNVWWFKPKGESHGES